MTTAIDARVEGMVQGVGFRYWTLGKAQELGLTGWVRNEADGDVTAHFEGPEEKLAEMIRALHQGPRWSRVTDVQVSPSRARGCVSFELVY
ncbi:MAG: acylphosphatase [Ancrocorticia sp.]